MPNLDPRSRRLFLVPTIALAVAACSSAVSTSQTASPLATTRPTPSAAPSTVQIEPTPSASTEPAPSASTEPIADASQLPDTGGGTTSGDVPDNAVFLTYRGGSPAFSIQYVEGWQVSEQPDGVIIRDKDSSETIVIGPAQTDVPAFVSSTDLRALQGQQGFKLVKQDTVKVGGTQYVHLVYHLPAPPDPVTGKRVPSTVDRYYVPGPAGLAIVSLSTPDGVDNVDAFRQMIESFKWS